MTFSINDIEINNNLAINTGSYSYFINGQTLSSDVTLFLPTASINDTFILSNKPQIVYNKILLSTDGNIIDSTKLNGFTLSSVTPSIGDALIYNGNYWTPTSSNFINKKNSDTPHTGTTSPTVIHSFEITPGTCEANDVLKFYIRHFSTNNANSKTVKIWANSSNTISGATQLSNYAYTTNSGGVFTFKRSLIFKNSLTSQKIINTTVSHANDDVSYPNNGDATLSLDFNNSVFIFIEVTLANASDTFTMNLFNCKIER